MILVQRRLLGERPLHDYRFLVLIHLQLLIQDLVVLDLIPEVVVEDMMEEVAAAAAAVETTKEVEDIMVEVEGMTEGVEETTEEVEVEMMVEVGAAVAFDRLISFQSSERD